ncbi:WxL domain-containing protein [Companilactobacillus furfuricola]|uniref:WxL domain-containing protein n=1 Tax=Companilactobacillus furfuricola TaxID=1462575 RepID=UPI000F798BAC|nr:WxL domain-containing protein [Companilactobacillus furfuricola]
MKISRNILVSSMALAGITLGALAPTTAQAAKSGVSTNPDAGTFTVNPAGQTTTANMNKGEAAFATPENSATAESDANVQVISGFLSLDAVPDFSFGRAIEGNTAELLNGQSAIQDDGNQDGLLQITESRTADSKEPGSPNKGFTLSAQLGDFVDKNGTPFAANGSEQFKMNLKPQAVKLASDGSIPGNLHTSQVSLLAGGKSAEILTAKPEDKLMGTYKMIFEGQNAASLYVPKGSKSDNAINEWKSKITWTLNAAAAATTGDNSSASQSANGK